MKKTQLKMIKDQLLTYGEVSRNWCLSKYCSRLGARINDLKRQGWTFETEKRGGDFVYIAIQVPVKDKAAAGFNQIMIDWIEPYVKNKIKSN